jgi:uncharacterized protein (TIGR02246 family)
MHDEFAIQQNITRYTEAASRAAWDEVVATFAPDGIWEIIALGKKFEGRDAIKAAMMAFTSTWEYGVQINAPAVIEVTGDTATARSVVREVGKSRGEDEVFEMLGIYIDKLVRTAEGWKFAHRVMQRRGKHYYKVTENPTVG